MVCSIHQGCAYWLFITLFLRMSCGISPPLLTWFYAHWTGIFHHQITSASPGTWILWQCFIVFWTLQCMHSYYTQNDLGIFSPLWLLCRVASTEYHFILYQWRTVRVSKSKQNSNDSTTNICIVTVRARGHARQRKTCNLPLRKLFPLLFCILECP